MPTNNNYTYGPTPLPGTVTVPVLGNNIDRSPGAVEPGVGLGIVPAVSGPVLPVTEQPVINPPIPSTQVAEVVLPVSESTVASQLTPEGVSGPNISAANQQRYITILANGTVVTNNATTLDFEGSGFTISSLGTTGATITINASAGGYGNTNVTTLLAGFGSNVLSTTGNITGGYILGNGSQLTGITTTYGNANVVANVAALGSNPVSTTGNITGGYVLGNGALLSGLAATYGNANVVANVAALGSNPVSTTGNITGGNISIGSGTTNSTLSIYGNTSSGTATIATNVNSGSINLFNTFNSGTMTIGGIAPNISMGGQVTIGYLNTRIIFGYSGVLTSGTTFGGLTGTPAISTNRWTNAIATGTNGNGGPQNGNPSYFTVQSGGGNYVSVLPNFYNQGQNYAVGDTITIAGTQLGGTSPANDLTFTIGSEVGNTYPNLGPGSLVFDYGLGQFFGYVQNDNYTNPTWARLDNQDLSTYTGNITAGNVSATGNVTGGNLRTGGLISATGNITSVANITGGNVLTAGQIISTRTGNSTTGAGQLYLSGTGNNRIDFAATGTGAPNATTRSAGTKLALYPQVDGTGVDYGMGVESGALWTSVHDSTVNFKWYANTTAVATLTGTGNLSATGNVTGGNILTAGVISAGGNIFGGNAVFSGNLSVAGNVTYINSNVVTINDVAINLANNAANVTQINGGGIELGPQGTPYVTFLYNTAANTFTSNVGLSAVANITGGNILTAGVMSSTGNAIHGNISTAGSISSTGNITTGTNGFIGVGTATPDTEVTILANPQTVSYAVTGNSTTLGTDLHITGADGGNTRITQDSFGTGSYVAFTGRTGRGTAGSPSQTLSGDTLAQFTARGFSNGALQFGNASTGRVDVVAAENFTDTARGTNVQIYTTAAGAITPTAVATFSSASGLSVVGNVTAGNVSVTGNITGNTNGFTVGYLNIPQVSLASNVSVASSDAGKHYYTTSASNLTLTVANNTSVSWAVGTAISVINRGTANVTIAQDTGVSLYLAGNATSGNRIVTTYGMATLINTAANVWMISGTVV